MTKNGVNISRTSYPSQISNCWTGKLVVDMTRSVSWSGETFDRQLVLKAQKKELIKALITVHTAPNKQHKSDIIEGKGKGLILLLHGGPGKILHPTSSQFHRLLSFVPF